MKFIEVHPKKDEVYEVAYDDYCIVIKQGEDMVWISESMARWIVINFPKFEKKMEDALNKYREIKKEVK